METVLRKGLLYKSGLGFWCINHVQGCAHGCAYPCYALMMARQHGRVKDAAEWNRPLVVRDALPLLERELSRKRGVDRVHLSLTTDPFMMGWPEVAALSLELIAAVNRRGIPCTVLTKGLLPAALQDGRRFHPDNVYGISLVSLDENFRRRFEPGAAPFVDRLAAARLLAEQGLATRVHMEPYPPPNVLRQDLAAILNRVSFARELFLGPWNYNSRLTQAPGNRAFYAGQAALALEHCQTRGIDFSSSL